MSSQKDIQALRPIIEGLADLASCQSMISATIIPSVGAVTTKMGSVAWYGIAQGRLVTIAATTVLPALVGTIAQNKFNVYCYYIDSAGTVTSAMGVEGTTKDLIKWPIRPTGKTLVGASMFNPTTAAFIGGTTLADAANTNHVGLNALGAFDPSMVL
jgi:hypothetical protein